MAHGQKARIAKDAPFRNGDLIIAACRIILEEMDGNEAEIARADRFIRDTAADAGKDLDEAAFCAIGVLHGSQCRTVTH